MKVVYLHQYFNTPEMAGGTRSCMMALRLVQAGHEVHMVTAYRDPTARRGGWRERVDGIQVYRIPIQYSNHMGFRQRLGAFVKFAIKSGRIAASIRQISRLRTSTPLTIALSGIYAARLATRFVHVLEEAVGTGLQRSLSGQRYT